MASSPISKVIQDLRGVVLRRDGAGLTDGELLGLFLERREEAALEALVRRHGPMVLGVCRRVLHNLHDAEDAFQATFLVLLRKAASIRPREAVGNWLYGVAYRTALEAKRAAARRRARESQVNAMPSSSVAPEKVWQDLVPLLDREVNRLPDKYRVAVVLCDLEGRTRREVARQLNLPDGTVSGRLTTARRMLAKRLSRHGLSLSGGTLAAALSQSAVSASVPALLVGSTVKAAMLVAAGQATATGVISAQVAALTEGVLKAMLMMKLKVTMAVCLAVGAIAAGVGFLSYHAPSAQAAAEEHDSGARQPSGAEVARRQDTAQDAEVQQVLDQYRSFRPDEKDLAIFQLDWVATLPEAKDKAAREQRPILLIVVTNSYGNMYTGHC